MVFAISLGATAITALVLHILGVGGYQAGEVVVAVVLGSVALAPLVAHRRALHGRRTLYAAALVIVAVVLSVPLSDAAPFSKGRLRAELDELRIPDFEVAATSDEGHSWCRPRCPRVTRAWRGPQIARRGAVGLAFVALHQSGLLPRSALAVPSHDRVQLTAGDIEIDVAATADGSEDGGVLLRVRLASTRVR